MELIIKIKLGGAYFSSAENNFAEKMFNSFSNDKEYYLTEIIKNLKTKLDQKSVHGYKIIFEDLSELLVNDDLSPINFKSQKNDFIKFEDINVYQFFYLREDRKHYHQHSRNDKVYFKINKRSALTYDESGIIMIRDFKKNTEVTCYFSNHFITEIN